MSVTTDDESYSYSGSNTTASSNMQFSFVISAAPGNEARVAKIIESIRSQAELAADNYEIIVVGGGAPEDIVDRLNIDHIDFDEGVKSAWITRKKNLGVLAAKFENVVILHDYIALDDGWYKSFCSWDSRNRDWSLVVTPLRTLEGERWRDFTVFPPALMMFYPSFGERCLLPYDFRPSGNIAQFLYVSGAYYIVKRSLAVSHPLDEEKVWGEGEDLEWYRRLLSVGVVLRCNSLSSARFIKPLEGEAPAWHKEIDEEQLHILLNLQSGGTLTEQYFLSLAEDVGVITDMTDAV